MFDRRFPIPLCLAFVATAACGGDGGGPADGDGDDASAEDGAADGEGDGGGEFGLVGGGFDTRIGTR